MRNIDYWKDELLKIRGGIGIINDIPVACNASDCFKCKLHDKCEENELIKWLLEEHVERPTLTKQEHSLCEVFKTGYLARDEGEALYYYSQEPCRKNNIWDFYDMECDDYIDLSEFTTFTPFEFITWKDTKPWSIKDLLALEVKDNPVTT